MFIQRYTPFLKLLFRHRKLLAEAVEDTRAEQLKKKEELPERDKYKQSDPTQAQAIKRSSKLKKVCVLLPSGRYLTLKQPENWLETMNSVMSAYDAKHIGVLLHEHFDQGISIDVLAGFHGISRQTAYDMRREFLSDVAMEAALRGLLRKSEEK